MNIYIIPSENFVRLLYLADNLKWKGKRLLCSIDPTQKYFIKLRIFGETIKHQHNNRWHILYRLSHTFIRATSYIKNGNSEYVMRYQPYCPIDRAALSMNPLLAALTMDDHVL